MGEALALCVGNKYVSLCGLHFHISGYNIKERVESLDASLDFIRLNKNNIVTPAIVNIGGGLSVCYVDQNVWNNIEQKPPNISYWPNKGAGHLYPGWSPFAKHSALAEILDYPTATGDQSIADRVRNMGVQLLVEPGRSSLDQAAVSIFRIKGTKEIKPSHYSIVLDGNSLSLSERWFDCEILSDPILLTSSNDRSQENKGINGLLTGASCLEDDVFSWRWIKLDKLPSTEDLVVYINTAPYQMDFAETNMHRMSLPAHCTVSNIDSMKWHKTDVVKLCSTT